MTQYDARLYPVPSTFRGCGEYTRHTPAVYVGRCYGTLGGGAVAETGGLSPGVSTVTVLSSTSIRVTFLHPAVDNYALTIPENYKITPALAVHSVTPEAVATPTYVDLVVDEQTDGEPYELELQRIVRA